MYALPSLETCPGLGQRRLVFCDPRLIWIRSEVRHSMMLREVLSVASTGFNVFGSERREIHKLPAGSAWGTIDYQRFFGWAS